MQKSQIKRSFDDHPSIQINENPFNNNQSLKAHSKTNSLNNNVKAYKIISSIEFENNQN
jgi:hypothetical protein